MATLRTYALLLPVLLFLVTATAAAAAVVHDPWFERFRVGEFREVDDVRLVGGWPADLLTPLQLDPGWEAGARELFAGDQLPRNPALTTWRIALPLLGSARAADEAYCLARSHWQALAAGAAVQTAPGPWTAQVMMLRASRLWTDGRHAAAATLCDEVARDAHRLGLSDAHAFVWGLRAARLRALAGETVDLTAIWRYIPPLGSYDTRSGWAIWTAAARQRGEAPLAAAPIDRDTAVMLATAGKLWMTPAELRDAGFDPELEAGLGALLLPEDALTDHFARHPSPPADGRFQGYWLRGQRRLRNGAGDIEELAQLPGLKDGHRLDLWRRASEKRVLNNQWPRGLDDLEQALSLMDSQASRGVQDRAREWVVQVLALALQLQRTGDAATIVALAERELGPSHAQALQEDAAALLARLGRRQPAPGEGYRDRASTQVRQGQADVVDPAGAVVLPDPDDWRHRLFASWARWGLVLFPAAADDQGVEDYRSSLQAVLDTDDHAQRAIIVSATAGRPLRGTRYARPLVDWALDRDIEILSAGACLPQPSPLADLRPPSPWDRPEERLTGHALLGMALVLGDDNGMISVAVRLPGGGVDESILRDFWYPVPSDPWVQEALSSSGVPAELLLAIARNESLFSPAVRSRAGALGYMQIMPFHYRDPAGPPGPDHWSHPGASLRAGARILAGESRRYQGDPYRTVAAYNAGSGAVNRWDRQLGGGADRAIFLAWIGYPETRGYTLRVLRDRAIYRQLLEPGS